MFSKNKTCFCLRLKEKLVSCAKTEKKITCREETSDSVFLRDFNLGLVIKVLVGATVSDFGLPWDLLAEIDFFFISSYFLSNF